MSISTINCTPIKPNTAFGSCEQDKFKKYNELSDSLNEQYLKKNVESDIKSPLAVGASLALAALTVHTGVKRVTNLAIDKLAPKAGEVVEKYLKTGADAVKTKAETLVQSPKENKLSTVKQFTGKILEKAENGARTIYKKIAYTNIPEGTANPERANKALANVAGAVGTTAATAKICTIDSNNDGIADVSQKSQNLYTGTIENCKNAFETVNTLSEIAKVIA